MNYTKEEIARAALEAGVGVEKIKQMLKLLPESKPLRLDYREIVEEYETEKQRWYEKYIKPAHFW